MAVTANRLPRLLFSSSVSRCVDSTSIPIEFSCDEKSDWWRVCQRDNALLCALAVWGLAYSYGPFPRAPNSKTSGFETSPLWGETMGDERTRIEVKMERYIASADVEDVITDMTVALLKKQPKVRHEGGALGVLLILQPRINADRFCVALCDLVSVAEHFALWRSCV